MYRPKQNQEQQRCGSEMERTTSIKCTYRGTARVQALIRRSCEYHLQANRPILHFCPPCTVKEDLPHQLRLLERSQPCLLVQCLSQGNLTSAMGERGTTDDKNVKCVCVCVCMGGRLLVMTNGRSLGDDSVSWCSNVKKKLLV